MRKMNFVTLLRLLQVKTSYHKISFILVFLYLVVMCVYLCAYVLCLNYCVFHCFLLQVAQNACGE